MSVYYLQETMTTTSPLTINCGFAHTAIRELTLRSQAKTGTKVVDRAECLDECCLTSTPTKSPPTSLSELMAKCQDLTSVLNM